MAAARLSKRFLNLKSSIRFKRSGSMRKFSNGLSDLSATHELYQMENVLTSLHVSDICIMCSIYREHSKYIQGEENAAETQHTPPAHHRHQASHAPAPPQADLGEHAGRFECHPIPREARHRLKRTP